MSRAERRAYKRMTKNQDPYALPAAAGAARARQDRQRARRAVAQRNADPGRLMGRRGLTWLIGGALFGFLLGLSLTWSRGGGTALLIGGAVALGWILVALVFAWWRRRERLMAIAAAGRQAARR
jgi:O-antigen ligase